MVNVEHVDNYNLKEKIESVVSENLTLLKEKVLIKPNWGGRLPIIKGENTDAYFLQILTEAFAKRKVKKIFIAHYPLLKIGKEDYSFERLLKITKIDKIKFPGNVEFLNLEKTEKKCINLEGYNFHLPKILEEVFYINLAKLKTHVETKVSLCMKNQMGMLPSEDKIALHMKDLERGIALLATQLKPDLSIIDGIVSMDKNGPHHGRTRKTNILVYSDNLLEADFLTSYLMGYNPLEIRHINFGIELGVGNPPENEIIDKFKKYRLTDFVLPKEYLQKLSLTIWPTTACSKCIFNLDKIQGPIKRDLLLVLKLIFKKRGIYNVVIGKGANIKKGQLSNIIAIGECTKNLANDNNVEYLHGCPPSVKEIFEFLKKTIIRS